MSEEETRVFNDQSEHEISREIYKICQEGYFTVFPVGFRAAGKTMLMSSIFRFSDRHPTKPFNVTPTKTYPFNGGFKQRDFMVNQFDAQELMERNALGSLDLFGMSLNPENLKLDKIKLNFIDISGEDIANIKTSQNGDLTGKLKAVFSALELDTSPVAFLLITPFTTNEKNGDSDEDTLQCNFINFLKTDYPKLYLNSRLFVIVTKWDQNNDPQYSVETFIKEKRPAVYSLINGTNTIYGAYSIGKVLETKQGGVTQAHLVERNDEYPWRFWDKLYQIHTGKSLIYKTWWQRLFS
jgi:hypothetical protein